MGFEIGRHCGARLSLALVLSLAVGQAVAGPADKIYYPTVEKGEREIELRAGVFKEDDGYERAFVVDFAWSPTANWKTELVVEYEGQSGQGGEIEALEWENVLIFSEPGEYFIDVGVLAEYERPMEDGPDKIKIGPLLQKEFSDVIANVNLIFARQIGAGASDETELAYGWELKWRGREALEFGVQGFGNLGELDHLGDGAEHRIGPALFSKKKLANGNKIGWDAAVLTGIGPNGPDAQARFQFEYEMY